MEVARSEDRHAFRVQRPVVLAAACTVVGFASTSDRSHWIGLLLLLAWQVAAAASLREPRRASAEGPPNRAIPLRFSGDLGRYSLWPDADGRTVEVRDGKTVVAELVATDEGDTLAVDLEAAGTSEIESLGTALGRAIEMVAAADAYHAAVRRVATASSRTPASAASGASVLRRIRSVGRGVRAPSPT